MKRGIPILLALLGISSSAWADDHARAMAAFDDARRAIEGGDCERAIPSLGDSLRYEPSVGAHLALADCLDKQDPYGAWRHLREAERLAYLLHDEQRKLRVDRLEYVESPAGRGWLKRVQSRRCRKVQPNSSSFRQRSGLSWPFRSPDPLKVEVPFL